MAPETMTATEAQPATKTDDVIKAFMRDDDFRRLNHHVDAAVDGEDVRAVFSIDMTATNTSLRVLITETGDVIETDPHGDHCSHCEANEAYVARRGTPNGTRAKERRQANCRHANAASKTKALGDAHVNDSDNACPNCGHYAIEVQVTPITRRTPHGDRVHVSDVEQRRCGHCAHNR
ncbi:hypothetical protein halTADL_1593 [Halohasta litchfieldiae]|jgi:hypothetical protein|uniref:Uncharacterized protein n=1 Tax=Halohasta litchfieldiae TaxID=1073996 RepID=A0A1H6Y229_9EURY|nr:hypothetical protein [Halohasta litchfieldiae]ATW88349.1 hypothetical protein halTADL_1593 [Halohasta litchfieldiae]SEJ33087.1 hypothetical protein SAMN05444271_1492 [Halohasta litchfieldiae]